MAERRHPVGTVHVEQLELDVSAAVPSQDPSSGRSRRPPWRALGAVVGALVAGVAVVAVIDPSDEHTDAPTSTTTPGPLRVVSIDDLRAVIPAAYHGLAVVSMRTLPEVRPGSSPTTVLYAAPGAGPDVGSWVLVHVDRNEPLLPFDAGFLRPPRATFVGDEPGAVGDGPVGDETTVFDHGGGRVTVVAEGLLPGQTESIARHLEIGDGAADVPDAEVPEGMQRDQTRYVPSGMDFVRFPTRAADRRDIAYRTATGESVEIAVSAIQPEQVAAVAPTATFFLEGATPVTVRDIAALAGSADGRSWVVWTEGALLVTVSARDVPRSDLLALADTLVLATDPEWDETTWLAATQQAAAESARVAAMPVPIPRIVDRGALRGDVSWWDVSAIVSGQNLAWTLRTGENTVPGTTWTSEGSAPYRTPFALETNGRQIYNTDPVASDAEELSTWYAGAIVVVDPALAGSVLRLTTDGPAGVVIETTVHEVEGIDGHLVAGAAARWTDHYTAELLGPDGTRLTIATDADPG